MRNKAGSYHKPVYGSLRALYFRYKNAGGSRKKVIHDRHLLAFVMGLAMIDVVIITTYTILEGVLYGFTPGIEQNKEKSIAFEGVGRKTVSDINLIWLLFVLYRYPRLH